MTEVLTAAVTVVLGLVVLVLGQIAQRFFLDPIQEQKRVIGEIAHAVVYYRFVEIGSSPELQKEAHQELRDLSARLHTSLRTIPLYRCFGALGWVEKKETVLTASAGLAEWSNSVVMKDDPHASGYRSVIIKALGLPT